MRYATVLAAAVIGAAALIVSDHLPWPVAGTWIAAAEARIGRPATPLSYAGVARRTTRRSVAYGAAAAGTACRTYYNAYGQAVTTCY